MTRSGFQPVILLIAVFNCGFCLEKVQRMSLGIWPSEPSKYRELYASEL